MLVSADVRWEEKITSEARRYRAKLESPEGWGDSNQKAFHGRGMDIFWNDTFHLSFITTELKIYHLTLFNLMMLLTTI